MAQPLNPLPQPSLQSSSTLIVASTYPLKFLKQLLQEEAQDCGDKDNPARAGEQGP